jgi:hypothetical protein
MQGMSADASKTPRRARLDRFLLAFGQTRANDPRLVPLMAAVALTLLVVATLIGALLGSWVAGLLLGLPLALLGAMFIFGQRASASAITAIEGRPGAAAAILQSLRGQWRVTPGVAFTRNQDFVHRVIGRPGIILVGEGAPARVSSLLKQEHRKVARVAGDTPVHEVSVGNGAGQVPLRQLQVHMTRLPRTLKPDAVRALDTKLAALDQALPMPKGPLPRGARRRM